MAYFFHMTGMDKIMKRYKLVKRIFLKKNRDFQRVYQKGMSYANHMMVLYLLQQKTKQKKVGFAAGKRLGNAVIRNRVKRLLREVYRLNQHRLIDGIELLLVGRKPIIDVGYQEVDRAFKALCKRAKILVEKDGGTKR